MAAADEFFADEIEKDPVADFLQREQTQLAELQDNFESGLGLSDPAPKNDNANGGNNLQEEFNASLGYGTIIPTAGGEIWDTKYAGADDSDQFSAIKSQDKLKQEPEKIRIWREEQAERLRVKDAESEKKKAEWRDIARKELEEWYKHRDELLDKTMKVNRDSEGSFVQERDEKKPGGEWERVCRLCDFNPKGSRNNKDVSRMRSILLQMKQTPVVR